MKIWKALSILNVVLCATILAYFIVSDVPSSPFILGHNNFPQTIIKKLIGGLFLSLGYPFVFLIFGLMLFNSFFALEKIKNPLPILSVISVAVLLAGIASTMNNQFGGIIGIYISELIKKLGISENLSISILSSAIFAISIVTFFPYFSRQIQKIRNKAEGTTTSPRSITKTQKWKEKDHQNEEKDYQNEYYDENQKADEKKIKSERESRTILSDETSHTTQIIRLDEKNKIGEYYKDNYSEGYERKKEKNQIRQQTQKNEIQSEEDETKNREETEVMEGKKDSFQLPPPSLLDEPESVEYDPPEVLTKVARELIDVLNSFGIKGRIISMMSGPVVNFFEFIPESGIRATKIVSLGDDIAIAMRLPGIRIVAPVPISGAVGFEVPRKKRSIVRLKEVFDAPEAKKMKIPLTLGKDIYGRPFVIDLHKLPHLLVAGTTGSGKSVLLNTIIVSLLMRFPPDDLKFILVDPKMLEFSLYSGIPNLVTDVVTTSKGAIDVLRWAVEEMMRRYQAMKKVKSKNLDDFIEKTGEKIPRIIVVIDEFADLMVTSAKKVEEYVMRLSQMARAAGIHLILTTQRPSTDVVTGIIKSNLPARIALRVSDKVNSRVILDTNGAETLLGQGDFLFSMPGITPQRGHAAYTSDDEIIRVVEHLKAQREPEYIEIVSKDEEEEILISAEFEGKDPKFKEAIEIAKSYGQVSISLLQRKLGIGFNRAARIVEEMEEMGIVKRHDKKLIYVGLPTTQQKKEE
ncbi:MAG: DNA translocase FtsK [Candidatus Calescibacterium sp.]